MTANDSFVLKQEEQKIEEVKGTVKNQYIAGICVNIISLSYGAFVGWASASFPVLQSKESPLETGPLTKEDVGWVGAMLCLGGGLGTVCFAWCAEKLGRRKSLMLIALPLSLAWILIPIATRPLHLCISRFLGGFAGGGIFGVIPIYVTEYADDNMRGVLGTFLMFSTNIGILFSFVLGYYFYYTTVAWIMSIPCLIFLLSFSFLKETPQHLIRKNKIEKAEKSFRYFRNWRFSAPELPEGLKTELEKLKNKDNTDSATEKNEQSFNFADFTSRIARKAIFLGLFLMCLNNFCGIFAMLNYTATIFQIAKSNLSPNLSAIVVGTIQIFGSYMSTFLVKKVNRKLLLTASCLGTAFGQISLGTFIYLDNLGYNVQSFSWIPLASFSFTILMACVGILPLTLLVLSEIMPPNIRNIGCMFCMLVLWMMAFVLLKILPVLLETIKLEGMVFMFGGVCLASVIITLVFLPETKGKSIETIMESL